MVSFNRNPAWAGFTVLSGQIEFLTLHESANQECNHHCHLNHENGYGVRRTSDGADTSVSLHNNKLRG